MTLLLGLCPMPTDLEAIGPLKTKGEILLIEKQNNVIQKAVFQKTTYGLFIGTG